MSQRILFVYQFLSLGGVEVVLRTRLQELIRRGIDARALFLRSYGGEKLFMEMPDRVEVRTCETDITEFLRRFDPDWIISLDTPDILPIACQAVPHAHLAYEVHSTYPLSLIPLRDADLLAPVTGILVPSRSQQEMVEDILVRPLPIRVVPNALPDIFFEPGDSLPVPGRPVVAWVGRLDPLKNWRFFIDLVHLVREKVDAEFWLIGGENSPYNEKVSLQEAINSKELADCFRWFPVVDHAEMPGLYRAVGQSGGCLVSSSWSESFGMTILEAMSSRCPVVAPDVIGLRDLVRHAETGCLYPPGDIQTASGQIINLLQQVDSRRTIIDNAARLALTFMPVAVVDVLLQVLNEWSASIPKSLGKHSGQVDLSSPKNTIKALRVQLVETALELNSQLLKAQGLQVQLAESEQSVASLQSAVAEKEQALLAITASSSWALVQTLRKIRFRVAPSDSQRERLLLSGMGGFRALKKEGIVKFLGTKVTKVWHPVRQLSLRFLRGIAWGVYQLIRPIARLLVPRAWRESVGAWIYKHVGAQLSATPSFEAILSRSGIHLFGLPTAYDVICFPIIEWEHRFQRPQQLATKFAQHGHRVFYLCLTFHDDGQDIKWQQVSERIFQVQLPGPTNLNRFFEPLPPKAQKQVLQALEDLFRQAQIQDAICMVQLPFWTPLALALRERYGWKIVYDCMDEHEGLTILKPEMLQEERKLAHEADLVLTSSQKLFDKHLEQASHLSMVRNAADFDHFNRLSSDGALGHLPHPIIGYYGAIMEWFDAELVRDAAALRPDWSFVLIGNVDTPSVEPMRHMPNVHFLGEQPYSRLPASLQQFDVCLIPFKLTAIIQSTNPVKFYEYLSAGKPVVATLLPELLPYQEFFYPVNTAGEMVSSIQLALREDNPARKAARIEWARHQTWQARYDVLDQSIEDLYGQASIIIVSYNNLDKIKECLESIIRKTHYPRYEVIVVDNGSTPDVVDYLNTISQQDRRIRVILNPENLGFAGGNNLGLQAMSDESEYIVLLNNDTVVTYGWLGTLVHWLSDPSIGLVGPLTGLRGAANEAGIYAPYRDLGELDAFADYHSAQHRGLAFDIPMLAMYCLAMRRQVFEEIGPLDEQFGIGMFEDDDYSLRAQKKGYRVICVEDVFIHHYGRSSFSRLNEEDYKRLFDENRRRFETKWNITWKFPSTRKPDRRLRFLFRRSSS